MSTEQMLEMSDAFAEGRRIALITQTDIFFFHKEGEARKHPAFKETHIVIGVRKIVSANYPTPE